MSTYARDLTDREIDALVRGYTDETLLVNYRRAAEYPATAWARLLSAELRRRGLASS